MPHTPTMHPGIALATAGHATPQQFPAVVEVQPSGGEGGASTIAGTSGAWTSPAPASMPGTTSGLPASGHAQVPRVPAEVQT